MSQILRASILYISTHLTKFNIELWLFGQILTFLTVTRLAFRSIEQVEEKYDQHPTWSVKKRKMFSVLLKGRA